MESKTISLKNSSTELELVDSSSSPLQADALLLSFRFFSIILFNSDRLCPISRNRDIAVSS